MILIMDKSEIANCCLCAVRESLRASKKEFNKTEDDLKSLQSVGQIIGEVLRPLDNERCNCSYILFQFSLRWNLLVNSALNFSSFIAP